jgi:hypothetical protein
MSLTMDPKFQRKTGRDKAISMLNVAIDALNLAKGASGVTPANIAFATAGSLLSLIRVSSLSTRVCRPIFG